jgi:hypothetical protein
MATSISKTSVAVGMDASAFKAGAEGLKASFSGITSTAGKLVGVLGLAALSIGGIKAGIEASFGKVISFEKTQTMLETFGKMAGDSKESVAGLVSTLSTITGRNDEAGHALGDMARKMMGVGFSAAETEKLVTSFYKTAKASPAEITETYESLGKLALTLKDVGAVTMKQYKSVVMLGIPIFEIMAAKINEKGKGAITTAKEIAAQIKLSEETGGASGFGADQQLGVLADLGDSKEVTALIAAAGGTFAGAYKKSKEEISLMFFEIGKAINAFFGGTKTYVTLFKMITNGVHSVRDQIELLGEVFANNRQWIEDFKHGIQILVIAFFRGFEVMGEQLVASKAIIKGWFSSFIENIPAIEKAIGGFFANAKGMASEFFSDVAAGFTQWATYGAIPAEKSTAAIKDMATATDTGTERISYMQEIFKGFGEYMTEFGNNFEAIFSVWDVLMESFGDGVSNVTNIWEGMYEVFQTLKTAFHVGLIAIAEIGVNSINGILAVFEEMAAFTQKWLDKFSYGLTNILEAIGLVSKGTTDAAMAQDKARGNVGFDLGRISTAGMAEGRDQLLAEAKARREANIRMYNERKFGLDKDKPEGEKSELFKGKGGGGSGGAGSQVSAPTLIAQGGAEEYKLIVERHNAKLQDGTKGTNDRLDKVNDHLEVIASNRPLPPRNTTTTLIASA